MPADLHTHSEASSDSSLPIADRLELAREAGIDTVAVTDHMAVHESVTRRVETREGVVLVAGVELNCTVGGTRVDILGQFVDPAWMRERVGATTTTGITVDHGARLDAETVIDWIHDAGGAAVLAHPGRYDRDLAALVGRLAGVGLDGIETAYPYDLSPTDAPHATGDEIAAVAAEHDLLESGGSDCHGPGYRDGPLMGAVGVEGERVDRLRRASDGYR